MVLQKLLAALNIKRLLLSLLTIGVVTSLVFGITQAFFSDTETSQNNVLAAGKLDLKIDNTSYLNHAISSATTWEPKDLEAGDLFFNFNDLKPGDEGEDTISIHVDDNDAWACMEMTLTKNDDNTCTEPELIDDSSCNEPDSDLLDGELGGLLNFIFWTDDGDNVFEQGETIIASGSASTVLDSNIVLADSNTNNVGGQNGDPLTGGQTYNIGKAWCFGTLTQNPVQAGQGVSPIVNSGVSCNGENLNNASQSDQLMADISFNAVQYRNNPNFLCSGQPSPSPTPSPSPSPTPIACITTYASSASSNNQGTRKDGSGVLANRSVPSAMFGAPQTTGVPSDSGFPAGSFFSLGFTNGNIVVGFAAPFFDQPGSDLQIFEVTGGVYPDEKVKVEVADTPVGPWTEVAASVTRDAQIDINPVVSAQFVRLTDVSNIALFEPTADAYDVDAVKAFCGTE